MIKIKMAVASFSFDPPLEKDSDILCPKCFRTSNVEGWEMKDYRCEVCEDLHDSLICPKCCVPTLEMDADGFTGLTTVPKEK